jgi:YidC/Oxa1 family membrane protein insertase
LAPRAATASATVVNGFVVGATFIDGGYGYTNTPAVRFIGGGGSGAQAIRVVLLPLTIRLARRALRNQEIMRTLQPEVDWLKKRFERKPERFFEEMHELYRKHDCRPFDVPALVGVFIQLPIFGMLYSSIRRSLSSKSAFLWIRNLASPDIWLTLVIVTLTGLSAYLMPSNSENRNTLIVIQMMVTFLIVWKLAAGLGLYWASSSLVGLFQTVWLRYRYAAPSRPA